MRSPWTRRRFLAGTSLAALAAAATPLRLWAIAPFERKPPARLRLSLAAYSFRDDFIDASHERPAPPKHPINLFQFVDYCADHGCDGAELTGYYFPPKVDTAFLLKLRRHAFLKGVSISGTAVGNAFTHPAGSMRDEQMQYVKQWIHNASVLGAPHIRVFAGDTSSGMSKADAKKHCIEALEECAALAGQHGIFLGIENHGGIVAEADDLLDIIHTVQSPWVGINLDTGNFHTEDPYADFERCAPFAVNVQLKAELRPRGKAQQAADLERMVGILRAANYQGFVALEYESAESPWKAVPPLLARLRELMG